jgi:UDP-2,3-diacylglucosamine hydrolase
MSRNKKKIYFLSDAHLGRKSPENSDREGALVTFLNTIETDADKLFILGDLFEFWFEYAYLIPKGHLKLLAALQRLQKAGTEINYIVGNHDFALGPYLRDEIGMKLHWNNLEMELQGKRFFISHGDGLWKKDIGYRFIKPILRSRMNQALYRLLPADFAIGLARLCSGASRKYTDRRVLQKSIEAYRVIAGELLATGKYDIVIMGHTHFPELIESPSGIYVNAGGWLKKYTYAVMEEGSIKLCAYSPTQDKDRQE